MSKEKIFNRLKPCIGDPAQLVMNKLVHLAKDCEFTIEMAKLLEFEYIDLDEACCIDNVDNHPSVANLKEQGLYEKYKDAQNKYGGRFLYMH